MTERVVVTNSELASLRNCEMRHFMRYELGRRKEYEGTRAMKVGSIAHLALQQVYRRMKVEPRTPIDVLKQIGEETVRDFIERESFATIFAPADYVAEMDGLANATVSVVRCYVDTITREDQGRRLRVVAVEQPFLVRLRDEKGHAHGQVWLEGVIDLLLATEKRALILRDHKFTQSDAHSYDLQFALNTQLPLYGYALRELGVRWGGSAQLAVVKQKPVSLPKWTKKGLVSAAVIETTRQIYERELKVQEAKGIPRTESQVRLLAQLPQDRRRWVCVHDHWYGADVIQRVQREAYAGARLIRLHRRGEVARRRNPSSCAHRDCAYRDACVVTREEERMQILEEDFVLRKQRHPEVDGDRWTYDTQTLPLFGGSK